MCRDGLKLQTLGMIQMQKKKEMNKVKQPEKGRLLLLRPFFFNYLVYGSADPIFYDLGKFFFLLFSKTKIFFTIFFLYKFSVAGTKPG